jgi:hypothetical protein
MFVLQAQISLCSVLFYIVIIFLLHRKVRADALLKLLEDRIRINIFGISLQYTEEESRIRMKCNQYKPNERPYKRKINSEHIHWV